jgi:hypothetical protein
MKSIKSLNSKKEKERNPHKKQPSSFLTKDKNPSSPHRRFFTIAASPILHYRRIAVSFTSAVSLIAIS